MSRKLVRGLPRKSNVGFGKLQIAMNNLVDGAFCKSKITDIINLTKVIYYDTSFNLYLLLVRQQLG